MIATRAIGLAAVGAALWTDRQSAERAAALPWCETICPGGAGRVWLRRGLRL